MKTTRHTDKNAGETTRSAYAAFGDDNTDSTATVDGVIDETSTRRELMLVARNLGISGAWRKSRDLLVAEIANARERGRRRARTDQATSTVPRG